ncbi:hypothetical protein MHU86_20431 [Fragilaria crotonensis]|nr:hypothetical protein MHU86_20431 [Fragilaria crotonensis]
MVRGNWQRRVEQTEARKAVAKTRRQKKDNRATFKTMVANLVTQMDKHRVSTGTIHVWTDTLPTTTTISSNDDHEPPALENTKNYYYNDDNVVDEHKSNNYYYHNYNDDDDGVGGGVRVPKRRGRSTSFNETRRDRSGSFNEIQARGRSGSFNDSGSPAHNGKTRSSGDGGGGKKAHPRSKEPEPVEDDANGFVSLCRTQFYKGKCDNLKNGCKRGFFCRHAHYAKHHKTLGEVLTLDQKDVLETAESSLTDAMLDEDDDLVGGMEMMYYFPIKLDHIARDQQNPLSGQILSQALSDMSCTNASLVYVAYENELIFDRYQTGVLVSELGVVFGGVKRGRSTSAISEISVISEASEEADDYVEAEHTPAAVLEYILTFLPDSAVALMARVCSAWHNEIGKTSSHLWRHMLERRKWPCPLIETQSGDSEAFFKLHYQVVRDVHAIKSALCTLINPRRGYVDEVEMVYQSFSARRTAPTGSNECIAMQVWSPTVVLAAYSHDCTIRLFKTVEKAPTGGRACRELISVCVDPYRKRSRRKARLVAMSLDGDTVGCLLHVLGATLDGTYVLSTISRNDYLEAAGGDSSSVGWSELEDGVLNVTDIGEAVVNYLLSADDADHRLFRLTDFLNYGGELVDVEVLVSHSLVACGDGRFLIEASISIPDLDGENDDDDDDEFAMIMLARKLVIISSKLDAIVWMGDSNPTLNMIPRRHDLLLSGVRHGSTGGGGGGGCSVVAVSSPSPTILLFEIDVHGQLSDLRHVQAAETVRAEMLSTNNGGWELDTGRLRPIALFPNDIVAVDVFVKNRGEASLMDFQSIISFYPRYFNDDDSDAVPYQVELFTNCNVLSMERVRDEHVLLLCEELESRTSNVGTTTSNNNNNNNMNDDDGDNEEDENHNNGDDDDGLRRICINVLIIHVPTRHLIDRIRLPMGMDPRSSSGGSTAPGIE